MASTFNLLTAGGARFDKNRFKHDFALFQKTAKPKSSRKGKEKAVVNSTKELPQTLDFFGDHSHHNTSGLAPPPAVLSDNDDSDEDEDSDEVGGSDGEGAGESSRHGHAPPQQKITLTGDNPLPKSLHSNLPSLTTHPTSPSISASGQPLLKALRAANIHSLWGVQCAVAGCLLDGRDVMCIAPTGSGKTLAYLLPTLVRLHDPVRTLRDNAEAEEQDQGGENLEPKGAVGGVRSLVLVPTHDLAIQIRAVLKALCRGRSWRCMVLTKATERAVCESAPGKKFRKQVVKAKTGKRAVKEDEDQKVEKEDEEDDDDAEEDDLEDVDDESTGSINEFEQTASETDDDDESSAITGGKVPLGIDILIATPERLHHLIDSKQLSLSATRHLILDESDRLLSSDFIPQVQPILAACSHPEVQKCFLSATMPAGSEQVAKKWLNNGVRVVVGLKDSAVTTVSQSLLYTGSENGKILALRNLVSTGGLPYPSLIFVQSVQRADELYKQLVLEGIRVDTVHGNRPKAKRDEAIKGFREGKVWMLVVTEVLARGMDFRGVKVVVNYDFPQTVQSYIHRIGRTGRAGRPGRAITFFSNEDSPHLRTIANVLQASGCEVPKYMLELPKPSKNLKKERRQAPVKRKDVGGGGRDVMKEMGKKKREMIEASKRREEKRRKVE